MTSATIDYYDVLGVTPDATPEHVRSAYRRAVLRDHPDRPGGSHERMVLVNEAWEVLSDPASRSAYDALRAEPQDEGVQERWEGVAEAAHEKAQGYSKDWEEFRRQMDALLGDVAAAEYGSATFGCFTFPTAANSVSGGLCILGGALLALVLCLTLWAGYRDWVWKILTGEAFRTGLTLNGARQRPMGVAILLAMPVILGAWAGQRLHRAARDALRSSSSSASSSSRSASSPAPSEASSSPTSSTGSATGSAPHRDGPHHVLVPCGLCGRTLRLPRHDGPLRVRCPRCGHAFEVAPQPQPQPQPREEETAGTAAAATTTAATTERPGRAEAADSPARQAAVAAMSVVGGVIGVLLLLYWLFGGRDHLVREELALGAATVYSQWQDRSSNTGEMTGSAAVVRVEKDKLHLVTNRHVLNLQQLAETAVLAPVVRDFRLAVTFPGGKTRPVLRFAAESGYLDLALLEVDARGLKAGTDYVLLPDGDKHPEPGQGDEVVAVGAPYGLSGTQTFGRVSSVRPTHENGQPYTAIQVDAAVNPGNSGGPLFLKRKEEYHWLGVNTFMWTTTGGSVGLNFAIDAKHVRRAGWDWYASDKHGAAEFLRKRHDRRTRAW
jgi:S1-C subfamily serine protease